MVEGARPRPAHRLRRRRRRIVVLTVLAARHLDGAVRSPVALPAPAAASSPHRRRRQLGHRAGAGRRARTRRSPSAGTENLVNQTVRVSWAGFRPSSAHPAGQRGRLPRRQHREPGARLPVPRRATRRAPATATARPASAGSRRPGDSPALPAVPPFTYPGQDDPFNATPDGPANWQDNVTRADGTGEVTIQLFTKRESAALGCDVDAPVLARGGAQLRPPQGRHRGPDGRAVGVGAPHGRPAEPSSRSRTPARSSGDSLRVEGSPMVGARAGQLAGADLHARPGRGAPSTTPRSASRRRAATSPPARPNVGLVIDPLDKADAQAGAASSTRRSRSPVSWSRSRSTTPTASRSRT